MSLASSLLTQARAWGFLTGVIAAGAAYVAAQVCGVGGWGARGRLPSHRRPPALSPPPPSSFLPPPSTQRDIWASTAWLAARLPNPPPPPPPRSAPEPLVGAAERGRLARAWNEGVDAVFGPAVRELGRRGW
jgi:hypothetical protein